MKNKKLKKTFLELGGGAILERIDHEFARVMKNINDLNTDPVKTREINVKIKIQADHDRNNPSISATVSSKLCATHPIKVNLFNVITTDDDGNKVQALQEASNIAAGQLNIDGEVTMPEIYIPQNLKS